MNEIIKKIINAGARAPSGDNCQPWRFSVRDQVISLHNIPERDNSLYNFRQNASLVAHGAVIENMVIAASNFDCGLAVALFPDSRNFNYVADCSLTSAREISADPLYGCIFKRTTNRKPYKNQPLTPAHEEALGQGNLALVTDAESKQTLARLLSVNERLVLENRELHDFLFAHIRWSEQEEKQMRHGMYIKTLELNPPQRAAFKLFRHWPVMQFFNILGAAKKVASENAKIYASSAAFLAFFLEGNAPSDLVVAGQLMQRAWLKAVRFGLSAQPLTGITFLARRVRAGDLSTLNEGQAVVIQKTYQEIQKIFGVNKDIITILRVGVGGEPSATSSRLEPEISIAP